VVVDAVHREPVSAIQIPGNWENKWEFFGNRAGFQNFTSFQRASSIACGKIPDAMELGILPRYLGIYGFP
jgi:hypothetical protein